jgi:Concanavalin A-like lectin/glucanases superfamily
VLLGLGVGVYGSLATPDTLATERIRDAVRAARLLAQREGAPASVIVDPARGDVYALGLHSAGNWHFEDDAGTGWPVPARHAPDSLEPRGVIGSALRLGEEGELIIPELPPSVDSPDGFGVELCVAPAAEPRPMTLLERPGLWALRLDDEGQLEVTVWLDAKPSPEEFRRAVPEARLTPGRFTRVAVVFDGRTLQVDVDGRRCGEDTRLASPRRMALAQRPPLRAGEGLTRFVGLIDELRLQAVAPEQHAALPADVRLLGAPRVLHLDPQGRLDPDFHGAPEVVSFEWGDPARRTHVELGLLGAVRSWTDAP